MLNFTAHNTTKIHFGKNQISRLSKEVPKDARILLAYGGGSIHKNGIYEQVKTALGDRFVIEFSGIEPNPKYKTVIEAVSVVKQNKLDFVLAVGGGSVIDGAKFIAAASLFEGEDHWDIFAKQARISQALPLGVVLTLPATGSETNTTSVITRGNHKLPFMSPLVRPAFAILDPEVTYSLSKRQLGNGVVDAFVHTIEQYLTYPVNATITDRFAESILTTLIEEGPKVLEGEANYDNRANIMWSATQALNGLIACGVPQDWSTHMIGHELTALYDIDHARTLSLILPAVMRVCRDTKREKLIQYAQRVWNLQDDNEDNLIEQAIVSTEDFFRTMGLPVRLSEVNLGAENFDEIILNLQKHGMTKLGEHGSLDIEKIRMVLSQAA
ncbi:MAG: iron-containing alcohol dehydrogenase [Bermanella sp.]